MERGLDELYEIMADQSVSLRTRLNAAVSASRIEPLVFLGEPEPTGVLFLRYVIDFEGQRGERFSPQFRREAAAALAFYQNRADKLALRLGVPDADERQLELLRRLDNARVRVGRIA